MKRTCILLLLVAALPAWSATAGDGLVGTWKLVEQRYESGRNDLLGAAAPVIYLEFAREGLDLSVRLRSGDDADATVHGWPAFVTDAGPLAVEIVERVAEPAGGRIRVRYRVRPSDASDLVLDIVEDYALEGDGRTLAGRMSVRFTGGERNRGGFVLHRLFERVP